MDLGVLGQIRPGNVLGKAIQPSQGLLSLICLDHHLQSRQCQKEVETYNLE
jgi:hypothetical protein